MKRLVLALAILVAVCFPSIGAAATPTITVIGEGTVTVPADSVIIAVYTESSLGNRSDAQTEVTDMMSQAINSIKAEGVKDEDIMIGQASSATSFQSTSKVCRKINNSTVCENDSTQATSLQKSATVRIKSTDRIKIDKVLNAAKSAGAQAQLMAYSLSDPGQVESEARNKAIDNAKENAKEMAAMQGMRLGNTLDISDYGYPSAFYENLAGSSDGRMVAITSYVMVTCELKT
jgi:uncharacterized protein YggE